MRNLFITLLLFWPTLALSETFLVNQLFENVRVVLSTTESCDSGQGLKASAQRIDKLYIPGCWNPEPGNELVRINWHNGDFSVLPADDFVPTEMEQN